MTQAAPSVPSILWIMTDEQRCDALGCYGSSWAHSPRVDAIAARGRRFENACTPSPLCVPARTIMLSGQRPGRHGVWSNAELGRPIESSLIDRFRQAGYATASFGKSHYSCHEQRTLFETETQHLYSAAVDPENYAASYAEADYGVVKYPSPYTRWILAGRFPEAEENTVEWQTTSDALRWLRRRTDARAAAPFLLRVSYNGPHTPVAPPERFLRLIDPDSIEIADGSSWDPGAWPAWYSHYLFEYARADRLTAGQIRSIRRRTIAQLEHLSA